MYWRTNTKFFLLQGLLLDFNTKGSFRRLKTKRFTDSPQQGLQVCPTAIRFLETRPTSEQFLFFSLKLGLHILRHIQPMNFSIRVFHLTIFSIRMILMKSRNDWHWFIQTTSAFRSSKNLCFHS